MRCDGYLYLISMPRQEISSGQQFSRTVLYIKCVVFELGDSATKNTSRFVIFQESFERRIVTDHCEFGTQKIGA